MTLASGQCLCGAFRFTVTGPLENVRLCHCDVCRRANGTAFAANCPVPVERFAVVHDEGTLRSFESSPGARRYFCGTCGSPVFARVDSAPDIIRIRLGTLDRHADAEIVAHVWVGSKARWDRIADELPCYARGADGEATAKKNRGGERP